MKRTAILFCILSLVACKSKNQEAASEETPIQEEEALILPDQEDSVYCAHNWKDPDFLFEAPSGEKIAEWKKFCENKNDGLYDAAELATYSTPERMLAVNDAIAYMVEHANDKEAAYEAERDEFLLWVLSEYMPFPNEHNSEAARFILLNKQIDGLMDYLDGSQYEMNWKADLGLIFEKLKTRTLYRRLIAKVNPELAECLKEENRAFKEYHKAFTDCFEYTQMTPGWNGSAAPMAYAGTEKEDLIVREKSLATFYYFLSDGKLSDEANEEHIDIPLSEIAKEYILFRSEIEQEEVDTLNTNVYAKEQKIAALESDQDAFFSWMEERSKIYQYLTEEQLKYFDRASNNLRRHKLLLLKNRYRGYGLTFNDDNLLPADCDDSTLLGHTQQE